MGHIDVPFNPLIEVPLLIYLPNLNENNDSGNDNNSKRISRFVSGTDIPSLVCDAAGVNPSKALREQWMNDITLSDCLSKIETEGYCLVDNASEAINTKDYEHPITGVAENHDTPPETTVRRQRLLVRENWKLYQVNNDLRFYRYGDAFFDEPVPDNEVPEYIQTAMHAKMADFDNFLGARSNETASNPYADIKSKNVRQQLKDLGYL